MDRAMEMHREERDSSGLWISSWKQSTLSVEERRPGSAYPGISHRNLVKRGPWTGWGRTGWVVELSTAATSGSWISVSSTRPRILPRKPNLDIHVGLVDGVKQLCLGPGPHSHEQLLHCLLQAGSGGLALYRATDGLLSSEPSEGSSTDQTDIFNVTEKSVCMCCCG